MNFIYSNWSDFCAQLKRLGFLSIPACEVTRYLEKYVVLKHDVETDVSRAFEIARIEHSYGHRGSYYVQAYLLEDSRNVELLKQMRQMGHEISYHYDVMDSCKGKLDDAIVEFENNRMCFETHGFSIKTVCQHGNPIVERKGYHSNRDFFRSDYVRKLYPHISDIMVNYKQCVVTEYRYFSDAGRKFKLIYDPINNDIVNSDEKNIVYEDFNELVSALDLQGGNIISIHPHRWSKYAAAYILKTGFFKLMKTAAKILMKIPVIKKIMCRYYFLAKKI